MRRLLTIVALLAGCLTPAAALDFKIENLVGDVRIRLAVNEEPALQQNNRNRPALADDVQLQRDRDGVQIICRPGDGSPIDLDVTLPFGSTVQVQTHKGTVFFEGMPALLSVQTIAGAIDVTAPWSATRFLMITTEEPRQTVFPDGVKFRVARTKELEQDRWIVEDRLRKELVTYGRVRVRSQRTMSVTLRDAPLSPDSPIKMHWQAKYALQKLLTATPSTARDTSLLKQEPIEPLALVEPEEPPVEEGEVLFSSDVRMVTVPAAVYDADGTPLTGLKSEDFEILEDGEPQRVAAAETEQAPFNLAILLDLSASTSRDRDQMKEVARRFIEVARPQDEIALYALFNSWFGALARLSGDHKGLAHAVNSLPRLAGASPLYDAMLLSYMEDLDSRRGERNALIVISDGLDNRVYGVGVPSVVGFGDLLEAAERMDSLIYPIFLGPPEDELTSKSKPEKALQRFREISAATGGRVFTASSIQNLDSVYEDVAAELRSLYSLAYYPSDQEFDGNLRNVVVRVKRPGATVRARASYIAR